MSVFHFKQFDITNLRSAMKVNTDGVLLGALTRLPSLSRPRVLDVGTGTGTIALMLAQRLSAQKSSNNVSEPFRIVGIDIDEASAEEAAENFSKSPWNACMEARHIELARFEAEPFDLIVSNPPYFDCSLKAPEIRRNTARHTDSLSYKEIMDFCLTHLNEGGSLALVLPADLEKPLLRYGRMCSLFPQQIWRIRTTPKKQPARMVVEFIKGLKNPDVQPVEKTLTLQDGGVYTAEYTELVHEFYLWA